MSNKLENHQVILKDLVDEIVSGTLFELQLASLLDEVAIEEDIWVLGAGKASIEMVKQIEDYFGDSIKDGMIIAPDKTKKLTKTQVFRGSHPYPDEDSISSSYELQQLVKKIPESDTVIFCLSGGASSLFCIPSPGIEIEELKESYELLLNSGASIHEINAVRKHISETAGGKLGQMLARHRLLSIILSDVPGDNVDVIGSGPTVQDSTTFRDAFQVLKKYQLWDHIPQSVRIHISKGMHGDIAENPQKGQKKWWQHQVELISGATVLAQNVGQWLRGKGFNVEVAEDAYDIEVQKISKKICGDAISLLGNTASIKSPAARVYFGESTVNVSGEGKGGRNQHLALSAALSIEGQHSVSLLSFATDGADGPTDAAGAIVNSQTTLSARKQKLQPEKYLQEFNSYHFHQEMGTLVKTNPTGNNLMDLQVVLVEK
ncbi:MAG: DUF4147 domain-containing protein [Gracilimonas sp.]|nr:DUF4147 domain-containing protein [Gracilimonas sp.]